MWQMNQGLSQATLKIIINSNYVTIEILPINGESEILFNKYMLAVWLTCIQYLASCYQELGKEFSSFNDCYIPNT